MAASTGGRSPDAWRRLRAWAADSWRLARVLARRLAAARMVAAARLPDSRARWRILAAQAQALGAALLAMARTGAGGSATSTAPGDSAPPASAPAAPRRAHPKRPPGLHARLIANPASGGMRGGMWLRELEATATWLTANGLPTTLCLTDSPTSASHLAEEAVRAHVPIVIAAGGDGTINQVVQALAGHTTALGVLPTGTVNVWARESGIPLNLAEARQVLLHGARRRIDLGRAGSRYFLLMAGVGIDAEATRRVERNWPARVGLKVLDYIATSSYLGFTERPQRIWVVRHGRRQRLTAVEIVIGNTRLFAGAFTFTQRAIADDGWLDVVFVGGHRLRHRAQVLLRALLRLPSLGPHARYERMRTLRLESDRPLAVQIDGELIGHLPMTFAVAPRALTVIVPHDAPTDLFQHPHLAE
ncbi:MAG TPA: diacylglycerol kinase family protein [Ktedonobacterales bacterium]